MIIASYLALRFIASTSHIITLIFISFFLAMALNPAVSWIARQLKSRSRVRATGVAYVMVLALLIGFFSLVIPPLISQSVDFINDLPSTVNSFRTQDSSIARFARQHNLVDRLEELSRDFRSQFGPTSQPIISTAGRIGSTLVSIVSVLVLTFMMLVEGPGLLDRFWALQPEKRRKRYKELADKMYRIVTGYVNGQVLIAAIGAAFALVALLIGSTVFKSPVNAVALAGIVFLFGLIPMIGNTLAAVLVVIMCLFASLPLAISMAVFFLVYQQIENVTLQPYIQAKTNELTPLLVFTAALLGAGLGGILGAFVAIPAAGCLKILIVDYYSRRKLSSDS